jgi:hypothetical protein
MIWKLHKYMFLVIEKDAGPFSCMVVTADASIAC